MALWEIQFVDRTSTPAGWLRESGSRLRAVQRRRSLPPGPLARAGMVLGDDVTELLGVSKYAPSVLSNLAGRVKGPFPSFFLVNGKRSPRPPSSSWTNLDAVSKSPACQ